MRKERTECRRPRGQFFRVAYRGVGFKRGFLLGVLEGGVVVAFGASTAAVVWRECYLNGRFPASRMALSIRPEPRTRAAPNNLCSR